MRRGLLCGLTAVMVGGTEVKSDMVRYLGQDEMEESEKQQDWV